MVKEECRLGFDPFAEWIGTEDDVSSNIWEGKVMPLGSDCTYNGINFNFLLLCL